VAAALGELGVERALEVLGLGAVDREPLGKGLLDGRRGRRVGPRRRGRGRRHVGGEAAHGVVEPRDELVLLLELLLELVDLALELLPDRVARGVLAEDVAQLAVHRRDLVVGVGREQGGVSDVEAQGVGEPPAGLEERGEQGGARVVLDEHDEAARLELERLLRHALVGRRPADGAARVAVEQLARLARHGVDAVAGQVLALADGHLRKGAVAVEERRAGAALGRLHPHALPASAETETGAVSASRAATCVSF